MEEEGMSHNAPLTPQNEIDRLAEVIAPSTIFFGRKYCYRQMGDSISGRRWGSRLWSKGCVRPLLLRLQCLMMLYLSALPFFPHTLSLFAPIPCFFLISLILPLPLSLFTSLLHHILRAQHLSPIPRVSFDHFCLFTMFLSLKRKTLITQ